MAEKNNKAALLGRMGGLLILTLSLCACNGLGGPESQLEAASASAAATISKLAEVASNPDPRLPARVSLCGEPLDLSRRSVYERLEFEFLRVVNHPAQVALWQRRAAQYFPYIEAELRAAGLPEDLKYLAVAESDLRPWVASPAGALGLWQFMPATARHYGVTVNKKIDQRQLPEPLLGAAVRYFKSLKARFGAWSLAMAAYNAGDGRIAKALADQGVSDYFELDLPRETERYVYRIAAIKVVMENAAHYGLNIPVPAGQYQGARFSEKSVELGKAGVQWPQLARQLGCDYKTLRLLNPHIIQTPLSGAYVVRLPSGG